MLTLSKADAALKEYYLDALSAQLNGDVSPFFNAIEKNSQNIFGKYAKCAVYSGKMNRVIGCDEDADLPLTDNGTFSEITMELKNIFGGFSITDKALRASQDSSGAIINLLDAEMEGLVTDAKANFARMMYGDGNGTLANILSVDDTKVYLDSVKQWFCGLRVDIYSETKIEVTNLTIKSVNSKEKYVEFVQNASAYGLTAGQRIAMRSSNKKEIHGLAALFNDSALYGEDKVDNPYFQPYKAETSELTSGDLVGVISAIEERSGGKVKMILCSHEVRNKIAALFSTAQKVVTTNDINLGYSSVYVNEVPVYADRFCPDNKIYFVNPDDFVLCQLSDWSWLEDKNGCVLRVDRDAAAYVANIVMYAELICKKPCGQGVITL
ncbi:MAG: phage major capsid protein [Candidatus Coproplasma sp.]